MNGGSATTSGGRRRARSGGKGRDGAEDARSRRPGGRTFARLAAIQAMYQIEQVKGRPEMVVAEFERHRLRPVATGTSAVPAVSDIEAPEESLAQDADRVWFRDLVLGTCERQAEIDLLVNAALDERRDIARMEITLRAIMRAGTYELLARVDTPTAVVIAEYVALTHDFFGKTEADLVNAVLDRLGRELRHRA